MNFLLLVVLVLIFAVAFADDREEFRRLERDIDFDLNRRRITIDTERSLRE